MKISQLIDQLKVHQDQYGDLEVMIDRNSDLYSVCRVYFRVADENEFPESWNIPEGFEFIEIGT